jgi:hypothetical protein
MEKWILPDASFRVCEQNDMEEGCRWTGTRFAFTTSSAFRCLVLDPLSPYRGLLLYHGLVRVRRVRPSLSPSLLLAADKKVVVLAPASLRKNFEQEVIKCGGNEFTSDRNWMLNEKNEVVPSDGTDGIAFDALTDAQNLKPNSGYAIL